MVGAGGQVEQVARHHLYADPLVGDGGANVEVADARNREAHLRVRMQMLDEELVHLHASETLADSTSTLNSMQSAARETARSIETRCRYLLKVFCAELLCGELDLVLEVVVALFADHRQFAFRFVVHRVNLRKKRTSYTSINLVETGMTERFELYLAVHLVQVASSQLAESFEVDKLAGLREVLLLALHLVGCLLHKPGAHHCLFRFVVAKWNWKILFNIHTPVGRACELLNLLKYGTAGA